MQLWVIWACIDLTVTAWCSSSQDPQRVVGSNPIWSSDFFPSFLWCTNLIVVEFYFPNLLAVVGLTRMLTYLLSHFQRHIRSLVIQCYDIMSWHFAEENFVFSFKTKSEFLRWFTASEQLFTEINRWVSLIQTSLLIIRRFVPAMRMLKTRY